MYQHIVLLTLLFAGWFGGDVFKPEDFITLSSRLSPEVKLAVREESKGWRIRVEAENPYARVTARLAIASGRTFLVPLDKLPAEYLLPASEIIKDQPPRLALETSWFNTDGSLRQREVFRAPAIGGRLPEDAQFWEPFDYEAYRSQVDDLAQRIRIPVNQPVAGKLSVVIEDSAGRRIRNLISGQETAVGRQMIEWDGRDETGSIVSAGSYRFRTASHPGITPEYIMQFDNGGESFFTPFGSNHGTMTAMAANSEYVFAAAPLTEGGWAIIALNPDGTFVRGYRQMHGAGIQEVFITADDNRLYVLNDGLAWGGRDKPAVMTLSVYDIASGNVVGFKETNQQFATLRTHPQSSTQALAGAVLLGNRLYLSDRELNCIHIVDPAAGKIIDSIPLPQAGVLTVDGGRVVAASGKGLVTVDPVSQSVTPLFALPFEPRGIDHDQDSFYLTGSPDSTIKVFNRKGECTRTLGLPGGAYQGPWQPERLINPIGVTIAPGGALWTAEDRRNPKRLSQWDLTSGRCIYDKTGCPAYGSPAGGFDPDHPERWFGQRCQWEINQKTGESRILSVLQKAEGHLKGKIAECLNYRFVHQNGRTFVLGMYKGTLISELMPDGSLKDLALISDLHSLLYGMNWKRVPAYCDTVEKLFPKAIFEKQYSDSACRYIGVLWVDQDGDADFDADEFQFLPENTRLSSFGWGLGLNDLTLRLPWCNEKQESFVLTLKAETFNAVGAPEYSFTKALAQAAPLQDELPQGSRTILDTTLNDTRGNIVVNTDPYMFSIAENGKINWFFPNRWTNVHGSHKAPLPRPGEMQGILFGLGTAPLDRQGDVMVFAGNHGRFFLMTTDGIYLDEMFQDCRVAEVVGPGLIGGEAFGGFFGYDPINKRYVLQAGSSGYRIYHLKGLDRVVRSEGILKVTPEMLAAAARRSREAALSESTARQTVIKALTGKDKTVNYDSLPVTAEWSRGSWNIRVRAGYDATNLYLQYNVSDPSPWMNNGSDWTQLFKTGDTVDLQLGTDPSAPAARRTAAPGDIRLSIAPFNGQPLAVLYRYRLADKTGANPIAFASPWRSETVDDVRQLPEAAIKVQSSEGGYRLEAAIPLAALNLTVTGGLTLRGDFGVIYGDRLGTVNLSRVYWSNQATGLVNDVPGETMLAPELWGEIKWGD